MNDRNSYCQRKFRRLNNIMKNFLDSSDNELNNTEDLNEDQCSSINIEPFISNQFLLNKEIPIQDLGYAEQYLSITDNQKTISSDENKVFSLKEEIAAWAIKHKISCLCSNELLDILHRNNIPGLPRDSRTLLNTPRHINVDKKCGGEFLYFGIECGVTRCLKKIKNVDIDIKININIDGLPLFKSSLAQLWPILGLFKKNVFVIALFCGTSKPSSLNDYLNEFIAECKNLSKNGIYFEKQHYNFKINAFVCDAPARAYLKNIMGHTSKHGCERCEIVGESMNHRIIYKGSGFPLRTLEKFDSLGYHFHQKGFSPLKEINISFNCFVLDYMHLICLGVVKRILVFLKHGPRICKLSNLLLAEINYNLIKLKSSIPSDFARQPRSLLFLDRWKATEFRQFLMYTGVIVLKGIVSKEFYIHFLSLHVATSILLNSNRKIREHYLDYARQLFAYFVTNAEDFYGNTFPVYNVHSLLHIADDVEKYNVSLNEISAFPFENFLQTLKKDVRNHKSPVAQVAKRYIEFENCHKILPSRKTYHISDRGLKDSCFVTKYLLCIVTEINLGADTSYFCHVYKFIYYYVIFRNFTDASQNISYPIETGKFQKGVMKFMAEVKIFMNDMNTFMGKQINNRGESNREELKQLLDIDEFLQFEENLVEPVFRTKIIEHLKQVGGVDGKDAIRRIIDRVFSVQLQSKLNMKGTGHKLGIEDKLIWKVIKESVFAIFPQVREAEIRERASVKLKNAPGRKSGDRRKIQNTDK